MANARVVNAHHVHPADHSMNHCSLARAGIQCRCRKHGETRLAGGTGKITPMMHVAGAESDGEGMMGDGEDDLTDAERVVGFSSTLEEPKPDSSTPHGIAKPDGKVKSNGVLANDARDAGMPRSISTTSTSTSAKFASLRATFEQKGSVNGLPKRRFVSSEAHNEPSRERQEEHEREIARLRDELEKERELREAYEEKCTALEEEAEELREQLEQGDLTSRTQVDHQQSQALSFEVQKTREQANTLQRQLSEMKRNISTSTRIESEVTDSTFAQEMGLLHHELQNWVVNNFRRASADLTPEDLCARLEKVVEPRQLEMLRPVYAKFTAGLKLPMYQATAVAYLIEVFDAPLLFGLPADQEWCKRLRQASDSLPEVLRPVAYNKWRSITLDLLRQSEHMGPWIEHATAKMSETICIALSILTVMEESDARRASLNGIVKRAVSLAHLLRVQRAQYEFHLPSPNTAFDAATTDAVSGDAEALPAGVVICATFPSVVKIGDEQGDNLHLRNVICKAKAICGNAPKLAE